MSVECSICEHDLRGGHDSNCPQYIRRVCKCGHLIERHDEEGVCQDCDCGFYNDFVSEIANKMVKAIKGLTAGDVWLQHLFSLYLWEAIQEYRKTRL